VRTTKQYLLKPPGSRPRATAKPLEMSGRPMEGYVFIDPPPRDERTLRDWLELGVAFVNTLPPKPPRSTPRRSKTE
jgi:hypothetical protein